MTRNVDADWYERFAERAREEAGVAGPPVRPVNVVTLARRLGVDRVAGVVMASEGRLDRSGPVSIYYRSDLRAGRQNFTVAHELGHLLLEDTDEHSSLREHEIEVACNRFAAALLMPASWIRCEFTSEPRQLATVRRVAQRSGVSMGAALVRLREVLGWRSSILTMQRGNDGAWSTTRIVGPPWLDRCVHPVVGTARVLEGIRSGRRDDVAERLPLRVGPTVIRVNSEISVHNNHALVLMSDASIRDRRRRTPV